MSQSTIDCEDVARTSHRAEAAGARRVFKLDAAFETGGVWAGAEQLAEAAYFDLLKLGLHSAIEEHDHELHLVLPRHRDRIRPRHLCLTDTAAGAERTRFYPVDRAYRIVNGLVELVLRWRLAAPETGGWLVVVRNFDRAQHLGARFFTELARRAASADGIDVIIEPAGGSNAPEIPDVVTPEVELDDMSDAELERRHPALLALHDAMGRELAAARLALRMLNICCRRGYYHEAKSFLARVLPRFDEIVGDDQFRRMNCVSDMNSCLVTTDDPERALSIIMELAAPRISDPQVRANMNYMLAMHHLRYARGKDVTAAEGHMLQAVADIAEAEHLSDAQRYPFLKTFINNGLAFLRVRQGRPIEAVELCQSGYRFLTAAIGEDRHLLHRSVLQYNTAQLYVMMDRLEEGLAFYEKAILLDPCYSEYHNEHGNILQRLGRHEEAVASYGRAIAFSPPYPEVHFNKGVCLMRQGRAEEALDCFARSLALNPAQPEIHALQAELFQGLERPDLALSEYDAAIGLGGDGAAVRVNRAVLHFNNGSFELALADMDRAIALDPGEPAHYENRAAVHEAMGGEDLRLRDLEAAERRRSPTSP